MAGNGIWNECGNNGGVGGSNFNKIQGTLGSYDEHPLFGKMSEFHKLWSIIQALIQENCILMGMIV